MGTKVKKINLKVKVKYSKNSSGAWGTVNDDTLDK